MSCWPYVKMAKRATDAAFKAERDVELAARRVVRARSERALKAAGLKLKIAKEASAVLRHEMRDADRRLIECQRRALAPKRQRSFFGTRRR